MELAELIPVAIAKMVIAAPSPHVTPISTPDDLIFFAKQTAAYTYNLAVATFFLAGITLLSIIAGIVTQAKSTKRDDSIRLAFSKESERIRQEQYRHEAEARAEELAAKSADKARSDDVAIEQFIVIVISFEQGLNLLISAPSDPIPSRAEAIRVLFQRAFERDIATAIPSQYRAFAFKSLIIALEVINFSSAHQELHDTLLQQINEDREASLLFNTQLEDAIKQQTKTNHPNDFRAVELLKASLGAQRSAAFASTMSGREKQLSDIYPTIRKNALQAKARLAKVRGLLGDKSGPLPLITIEDA